MKSKFFTFLFLMIATLIFSQSESKYYNSWRFGLNIGAMWQTADVRSTAGLAGGFTLEKGIFENKTNFFSLAIRGRGLFGKTYGLDNSRNYDVKGNPALNGTYNTAIRYDTVSAKPYIYNNYLTQINEGALELQISFNKLREKTNVLLNLWGGIGITSYRSNINLLDADGKMYNYAKVDSTGSKNTILSSHRNLIDGSYESYANGSKRNNIYTFSPSAGIGLGYKVSDRFSIIYEYKVTFPLGVNADYLDGIVGKNNDVIAKSNDYYHYSGLNLLFRLGKGKTKTKDTLQHTTTHYNPPVHTNTLVNVPPTNTLSVNPINTNISLEKPIVNFVNPSYSPYNEKRDANFNVSANVQNVNSAGQISVSFNGTAINNFSYSNGNVAFPVKLILGNNTIKVSASNSGGSDAKTAIINYSGNPPQINYTLPTTNPYTTTLSVVNVNANIFNIVSNYDVVIKFNGNIFSNYNFTTGSGQFSAQLNLVPGSNQLEINATNPFGSDNKKMLINYSQLLNTPTVAVNPSRAVKVTITNPISSTYKTNNSIHNVKAIVSGVSSAAEVTVTVNGITTPFTYLNGSVEFAAGLNEGNNNAMVSAKNAISSDSKTATINYEIIRKNPPPSVTITNPQPSPYITNKNNYEFKANTFFINSNSQIEIKFNGVLVSNYSYNSSTGQVVFNANLISNVNNVFDIKVTNTAGSNSASAIVKQEGLINTEVELKTKVICHKKDRLNSETITIYENEWLAHQAHGDYEGKCADGPVSPGGDIDLDLVICHNTTGVQKTITIKQSEWPIHLAHGDKQGPCIDPKIGKGESVGELDKDVLICHNDGNGGKQSITIKQSQLAVHLAHGDQTGACPKVVQIEPEPEPTIKICHIPPGNPNNPQTITISASAWPAHQAHGDYQGGCIVNTPTVNTNTGEIKKITICHIPPGNNSNPQTIEISENAWPAHEAHGDTKGACPAVNTNTTATSTPTSTGNNEPNKKITICHIPPGNSSNPQTIEISENAWPAHEAHGDTKGACVPQKTIKPKDGEVIEVKPTEGEIKQIKGSETENLNPGGKPIQKDTIQKTESIKIGRPR